MNNPIDLLRQGITEGKWSLVCDGFAALTGERLASPHNGSEEVLEEIGNLLHSYFNGHREDMDAEADLGVEEPDWMKDDEPPPPPKRPRRPKPKMDWEDEPEQEEEDLSESEPEPTAPDEPETPPPPPPAEEPRPRSPASQFAIEHGEGTREGEEGEPGHKYTRAVPIDTTPTKNRWVDNKKIAADVIAESKKLSRNFTSKERRDEFKMVRLKCSRCPKEEDVHPDFIPRALDKGDGKTSYICNSCIGRAARDN